MPKRDLNVFLNSDAGAAARYQTRRRRRVNIRLDGVESQSKRMPPAQRIGFQKEVARQLADAKRGPFRGDIALRLDLTTSGRTPPHAHTIAKNILDLLGTRLPGMDRPGKPLLYADDSQVQALSVVCRHGEEKPAIHVTARPLTAMLDDLELATEALRKAETAHAIMERDQQAEWVETLRDLHARQEHWRGVLGDDGYEGYRTMVRWNAQRALLSQGSVDIPVLTWMYGRPQGETGFHPRVWADLLGGSKLRLQVGELPVESGGSAVFKARVANAITEFKRRWDWVIDPLVVAVALEVVIRPSPKTPAGVLHDLDNIVRDYLIPSIVPTFGTVSDHRWTIDFDALRAADPSLADAWGPNPTPPAGTRSGVTRYEVWRIPAAIGEPGMVSVSLVADADARGDLMEQADRHIRAWQEDRFDGHRPAWRRF